jgi:hypothetical protein
MNFVFLSVPTFEPWDWNNPDLVGIGGSETSHIEMSNRLSDRGHEVYSYGPTPFKEPCVNLHNVRWERCDNDPGSITPITMEDWLVIGGTAWAAWRLLLKKGR